MAEAAFSEDGKYFSGISQDGRLRIWDTETNTLKQEYTPDLHLSSPPSCLQWISVTQSTQRRQQIGNLKTGLSDQGIQCIALGTTSGKILIYSVAQSKVETVLEDTSNSQQKCKVSCLDWHRRYGLYSCNKDGFLHHWDLQTASINNTYNINVDNKSNFSAIKIIPHNKDTPANFLVTVSYQVRIWRLHNGEAEVIKCLGHTASPSSLLALASLNNVCWLIEGSQTERLLSFWDVTITDEHTLQPQMNGDVKTPTKKKRKKSNLTVPTVPTPTYNFVLEDAPKLIDIDLREEDGGAKLNLAATTRSGVVHYYGHMLNGASTKPIKPSVTVHVTTPEAEPMPLQCCRLSSAGVLLLGYLHGPALVFETWHTDLTSKTKILIRGVTKMSKNKNSTKQQQISEVTKVRAEGGKDSATYVEPMGGVSRKRPTPGGKVEVPMEQRLANLSVDVRGRSKAAVNQNLTRLLMQALHSKDRKLIGSVLQNKKPGVALHTVSGLPPDYVPLLLEQLCDMATAHTSRCEGVCVWLNALLRSHSALLLATVNAHTNNHLTQLLAIFAQRRSHLCQLLNLRGRLGATLTQRQPRAEPVHAEPVLQYNDSSSEEDVEMADRDSESEGSEPWAADSGGDSGGEGDE